jgi:hypothetical protein
VPGCPASWIAARTADIAPTEDVELTAACPAGKCVLGGGLSLVGHLTSDLRMVANGPQDSTFATSGTQSGDIPVAWDGEIYSRARLLAICADHPVHGPLRPLRPYL